MSYTCLFLLHAETHHHVHQRFKDSRILKSLRTNCTLHSKNNHCESNINTEFQILLIISDKSPFLWHFDSSPEYSLSMYYAALMWYILSKKANLMYGGNTVNIQLEYFVHNHNSVALLPWSRSHSQSLSFIQRIKGLVK